MPPRRRARLAARRVPNPEPISLDDGDTESIHSAVYEACNGSFFSVHAALPVHRDCVDDGVDASRIDLRDLLEVGPEIQCPVCQGLADPQGCGPDAVHVFPCCPRSLFHLSCSASLTPVDGRVWCPACHGDVRSGVDADWFERLCHINGVEFPADRGCGVCTVCVEDMTVDASIEFFSHEGIISTVSICRKRTDAIHTRPS